RRPPGSVGERWPRRPNRPAPAGKPNPTISTTWSGFRTGTPATSRVRTGSCRTAPRPATRREGDERGKGRPTEMVTRGFVGRRQPPATAKRLPPGQHLVENFPVL